MIYQAVKHYLWSPLQQICAHLTMFPNKAEDSAVNPRTPIKLKLNSFCGSLLEMENSQ